MVLHRRTRRLFSFIERIYGDSGYHGPKAEKAAAKTVTGRFLNWRRGAPRGRDRRTEGLDCATFPRAP